MDNSQFQPPRPPYDLRIDTRTDADTVTLVVEGEIDLASAPALEHELVRATRWSAQRIVLDFGAVDFIDSTGLQVLLRAHRRADRAGHVLVLKDLSAAARRLLSLTGVDTRFMIE